MILYFSFELDIEGFTLIKPLNNSKKHRKSLTIIKCAIKFFDLTHHLNKFAHANGEYRYSKH